MRPDAVKYLYIDKENRKRAVVERRKSFNEYDTARFLNYRVSVQEKLKSLTAKIRFDAKGKLEIYCDETSQASFKKLKAWAREREDIMLNYMSDRYELVGYWAYQIDGIYYDKLPDKFVAYDLYDLFYDKSINTERAAEFCSSIGVHYIKPFIHGVFVVEDLIQLMNTKSTYGAPQKAGLYMRIEDDHSTISISTLDNRIEEYSGRQKYHSYV